MVISSMCCRQSPEVERVLAPATDADLTLTWLPSPCATWSQLSQRANPLAELR